MKLNDLYLYADQSDIEVLTYPMPENGSMSIMERDGRCYVGMDKSVQDGSLQEQMHLAHELGHCATGGFYNRYSPYDLRQKHERKADEWAIRQLIPESELTEAVDAGITAPWDLAELFDVTAEFMCKAIGYYRAQ